MIDQDKRKRKVPDWLFACVEAVTEVLIWWALGVYVVVLHPALIAIVL